MSSSLNLVDLLEASTKVTDWYTFGVYLKMPSEVLQDIERRLSREGLKRCKIELFNSWMNRYPSASWAEIAQALEKCDEHTTADQIRQCHLPPSLPAPASVPPSLSQAIPDHSLADQRHAQVLLNKDKVAEFRKLESSYAELTFNLKTSLDEKQVLPMKLGRYLIDLLEEDPENHEKLLQAVSIDKLFQLISPYYCFLNTTVLGDIIDKFIGEPLKHQLEEYEHQLDDFKESTSMSLLQEIGPQCSPSVGAPQVTIKLAKCWQRVTIKRFKILMIGFYQQSREITRFIQNMQREYKIPIRYLQEHCPLGTGGRIYHFRDQIMSGNPSAFFVFHSDVCCDFPVEEMYQYHASTVAKKNGFVILGTEVSRKQAVHYGCMVVDENTKEVLHYVEKPETFISTIINAGAYLFTAEVFDLLAEIFRGNCTQDPPTSVLGTNGRNYDAIDMEREVLSSIAGKGNLFVYESERFWSQIKTAGNAIYANRLYLSLFRQTHPQLLATGREDGPTIIGDVRIHPTASVDPSAVLGPNVYVGMGVSIGAGARVKEAIVLDRAEINVVITSTKTVHNNLVISNIVTGGLSITVFLFRSTETVNTQPSHTAQEIDKPFQDSPRPQKAHRSNILPTIKLRRSILPSIASVGRLFKNLLLPDHAIKHRQTHEPNTANN